MKVELTPDAALWVEAELAAGHFATAAEAVRFAIDKLKTATLRAGIEAAGHEGGRFTSDDVRLRLIRHGSSLSRVGASGKPGAVQSDCSHMWRRHY